MVSNHRSRLLNDPPSASPSQEEEEEEEEEEEMEVPEERQLEKSDVERSEEEEEDESFEEEEEESEADDDTTKNSPQNTTRITKLSQTSKNQSLDGSSEEEGEGSDTDDDTTKDSPTASSFIVKPVVNINTHSNGTKQPTTKRALIDVGREKDLPNKKTKVAKDHHSEESRKESSKRAGRIWGEDDEISILGGMIDFRKKKGIEAHLDMGAFLEFVKGRFTFQVTRTQLYEKIRRLKKKFIANAKKGEKFIPTQAHDLECLKLSKKIWGGDKVCGSGDDIDNNVNAVTDSFAHTENVNIVDDVSVIKKKANKSESSKGGREEKVQEEKKGRSDKKKRKKTTMVDGPKIVEEPAEPVTNEDDSKDKENAVIDDEKVVNNDKNNVEDNRQYITLKYPNLVASLSMYTECQRNLMMQCICLVDSEKVRELEDSWNELSIKETEFHCRKMELLAAQSRLVLDAWKQKQKW